MNSSIAYVVHDGIVEKHAVLRNNSNLGTQVVDLHLSDVLPIDEYLASIDVIESVQQTHDR